MTPRKLSADVRRAQILEAAKSCFARHGFAGTTTKSVAAAASVSEALLFKHFPTKAALHAAILVDACEADPDLHQMLGQEPSTDTLVAFVRGMVDHFLQVCHEIDGEEAQKMRFVTSSYLDDGEFARLSFEKIGDLIEPQFRSSLSRAIEVGDAKPTGVDARNLFWFAHQMLHMVTLSRLPTVPAIAFADPGHLDAQICQFILRGVGLRESAIARYFPAQQSPVPSFTLEIERA
jgi:AcrR family transcriptional regulator